MRTNNIKLIGDKSISNIANTAPRGIPRRAGYLALLAIFLGGCLGLPPRLYDGASQHPYKIPQPAYTKGQQEPGTHPHLPSQLNLPKYQQQKPKTTP